MFGDWWIDEDLSADEWGAAFLRAFKGEYQVDVSWGDFAQSLSATLTEGGLELAIALPFLVGDYNGDGSVDAADYTVWRDAYGTAVTPGSGADGNHDGIVDVGDYDVWKQHYGTTMPSGTGSAAMVPEPASLGLMLAGCVPFDRRPTASDLRQANFPSAACALKMSAWGEQVHKPFGRKLIWRRYGRF